MEIAILIVNGGRDPVEGKWIIFCIEKILQNTSRGDYKIFVWNNNVYDHDVRNYLKAVNAVIYIEAAPNEHLLHPHAVPLQRLYSFAKQHGPKYIVTMDSDAHPIRQGWLEELLTNIDDKKVISGIWRDELKDGIKPYIHPSCLCTTVNFIEQNGLRLDYIAPNTDELRHDTLSSFTDKADELSGITYHKLRRSNKNNFHRLMGGVYGDYIYHHGAGTRKDIGFWDEDTTPELREKYKLISQIASKLLFFSYDEYIGWLRGKAKDDTLFGHLDLATRIKKKDVPIQGRLAKVEVELKTYVKRARRLFRNQRGKSNQTELSKPYNNMQRPFIASDLTTLPDGWQCNEPDFVGVGVPKAGTSWWYSLMLQHPQVVPHRLLSNTNPVSKELHYFSHFTYHHLQIEDINNYKLAFASLPRCICGEFSTIYMHHPINISNLYKAAPDTKIIVILRNPIDRMISHINHLLLNRAKFYGFNSNKEKLNFFKKYSVYPEAYYFSLYANPVKNLLKKYKRKKILFLQYEKCKTNTHAELRRTFEFLGIDTRFNVVDTQKPINRQNYIVETFTDAERVELAEQFAEDVNELADMLPEFDYDLWRDVL